MIHTLSVLLMIFTGQADWASASCVITVTFFKKNGEQTEKAFQIQADTKKQCQAKAKTHETNFAPQAVAKKKVTFKWNPPKGDEGVKSKN